MKITGTATDLQQRRTLVTGLLQAFQQVFLRLLESFLFLSLPVATGKP